MTRILGVGSPFGADRLAWEAIDHLARLDLPGCELAKLDRPGSNLLAWFEAVDHLILLDAVLLDSEPGGVSLLEPAQLERLTPATSSHGFGVAQAIALARQLDQLPRRLQIVGLHTGADPAIAPSLDTHALEARILPLLS